MAALAGAQVCSLPYNLGVGGAMRTGYRYAVRNGYDVVVQIDADGQHDPRYLPALIAQLRVSGDEGADLVIGARFAGEGEKYNVSFPRRLAMRMLARILSRLAGTRLTDVTSGYRVANRRAAELFAAHYPAEYLGDTVESMVIALRAGCRGRHRSPWRCGSVRPACRARRRSAPRCSSPAPSSPSTLALIRRWPDLKEDLDPVPQPLVQP